MGWRWRRRLRCLYSFVKCVSLDKREEATEKQIRSEALHSCHFPSGTGQIDPISFMLKLLLNFWKLITGKNTFCVEKCCRVSMRRTWLEWQWEGFEIREQDRLLKATLAMQYPVSGEQNPFVSWPRPHQTNQEKSVIELEESVYWKEYWGSAMAS